MQKSFIPNFSIQKSVIRYCVMFATACIIILATRYSSGRIWEKLHLQLQDTMQLVCEQNALYIEKELLAKQSLLHGIAKQIPTNPTAKKDQIIRMLKPFTEIYDIKRLGFIDTSGMAYTTDDYTSNVTFQDIFQASIGGKSHITGIIDDPVKTEEQINIFSVPVYHQNGNMISGVLFAAYRTHIFHELLNLKSFGGKGYSCIIKQDGSIVVSSKQAPFEENSSLFSFLQNYSKENLSRLQTMKQQMNLRQSGMSSCLMDSQHYIYYMPLDASITDSQWYIITIVPADVLSQRLNHVFHYVRQLLGIVVLVLAAAFFYYMYSYWAQKKQLTALAYKDALTGGDNYACFREKMKQLKGTSGYIISTDIYEFRIINNICGVSKGNEVLQNVWDVLNSQLSSTELAAHIHADRFIFYWTDFENASLEQRIEHLNQEIAKLAAKLNTPRVMLYMGIFHTDTPERTEEGYGYANQAKHAVKDRMDKNYSFYEEINFKQWLEERSLEDEFSEAVQNRRFEVWYQPKYSTKDQKAVSAEALVRWRNANGELIPPYKFIPLFEKNGMISILDEYVFDTVCAQQKKWEEEGLQVLPVSVNISRSSLYYSDIVEKYEAILRSYHLPAQKVQLEITESAAVNNSEIDTLIDKFHSIGFHMLLDDFGTGYSSLSTLNEMHFDTLKLDKSLIDHIGDSNGEKLLYHIIKLAQSLGLKITAEGVEYQNQFEFLRQLECDDIQGYYFSRPLPMEDYKALLPQ